MEREEFLKIISSFVDYKTISSEYQYTIFEYDDFLNFLGEKNKNKNGIPNEWTEEDFN